MTSPGSPRLLQDIRSQPDSLTDVLTYHLGEGRAGLMDAAAVLRQARRVIITGMGASMHASIPFQYRLWSIGIDATLLECGELVHHPRSFGPHTVIVLVSRSGESVEVVKLLEVLDGKSPTIAVTNVLDSTLARGAHHVLRVRSRADEAVAIQTYTGTLIALELLAGAIADALPETANEANTLIDRLRDLIDAGAERLSRWDAFFESRACVHLLARGPSIASAQEGALLLNETAKLAAVGMSAASFRHGPVEVVDRTFAGLVFAPATHTGMLNLALARDLVRFGGRVLVVGRRQPEFADLEWYEIPGVAEQLVPLLEIIPIQLAALRLAESRGFVPGRLRYTPVVSRDEADFAIVDQA